ncbi:MAG: AraC family transcriptional regulator [Flavobacteriales bacterium]
MSSEIHHIRSISELHSLSGLDRPTHPLISVVDVSKLEVGPEWVGKKLRMDLYSVAMKDASCGIDYGRNTYDFNEGVLIFTAPDQVTSANKEQKLGSINGWMIFFHPDLIRNTTLGKHMDDYGFFSYDVNEALHLSDAEQNTLNDCVELIRAEIGARIDGHSQRVIVSTIELLLNYSQRYYERQFHTRSAKHTDVVSRFEALLKDYYRQGEFTEKGMPTIEFFAEAVHLSPNYLSDLLKKETGMSAKDNINHFVVEKAKDLLLGEDDPISGVAYQLGFNYPHYFSRLFKARTGMTPNEYRSRSKLN